MKNYYIIYAMIILLSTGCEDFLEEQPRDEIAVDQYFSEPEHARDVVNSLYRTGAMSLYNGGVYGGARIMFGPYISGFVDNEYKGQEVHVALGQELNFTETNLSSYLNSMWSDMYLGISRANTALKYIPEIPGLSEEERIRYMAEASFFRALNYFYLVRYFGGVPLITTPYENIGELTIERSSVQEVYALIVEDLNYAVSSGGLANLTMPSNAGRISKSVAQTVLAHAYLTMSGEAVGAERYCEAAEAARNIINSDLYWLTEHSFGKNGDLTASAYNKNKNSKLVENETIYYYEHAIGISNNTYPQWAYPAAVAPELAFAITNNAYQPTADLLNSYNPEKDLRIQEKQFWHTSTVLPNGETIEFEIAPHIWEDKEAAYTTALSDKATPIYTYANVLLMAAEAIARCEGVTAEAVEYLAQVRERAYWKEDPAAIRASLSSLSTEAFVEEVWEERLRELVFEFSIWFDVLRTRRFPVPSEGQSDDINFVPAIGAQNNFGGVITESDLLFPIPEMEMQRNPLLTQNPGY